MCIPGVHDSLRNGFLPFGKRATGSKLLHTGAAFRGICSATSAARKKGGKEQKKKTWKPGGGGQKAKTSFSEAQKPRGKGLHFDFTCKIYEASHSPWEEAGSPRYLTGHTL